MRIEEMERIVSAVGVGTPDEMLANRIAYKKMFVDKADKLIAVARASKSYLEYQDEWFKTGSKPCHIDNGFLRWQELHKALNELERE